MDASDICKAITRDESDPNPVVSLMSKKISLTKTVFPAFEFIGWYNTLMKRK
jgi:hypothetical protein